MNKKLLSKLLLLTMVISTFFALAACGNSEEDTSADSGDQVIEVMYKQDSSSVPIENMLNSGAELFEEANPGWTVELVPVSASEGDYFTKSALMMSDPETAPDVVLEDTFMMESDASAGYLYPLDELLAGWDDWEVFYESMREGMVMSDGQTYGVPIGADVRGLWYNYDAFEAAGIPIPWQPTTWQEIIDAAYALQESGYTGVPYFGYASKASSEGTLMQHVLLLLYGTEDELYNYETGKWTVESQGLYDTLCFIDEIWSNGLGPSPEQFMSANAWSIAAEELAPQGQVGILVEGSWKAADWERMGFDWESEYGFAMMPTQYGQEPGYTTMAGGWAMSVSAYADDPAMAFEYITYCLSYEVNLQFALEAKGLSPRTDVAENSEYQEIPMMTESTELLQYAHYRPALVEYPQVSIELQAAVESVALGDKTPEEAMKTYAENVTKIVGEENVEMNEIVYK